MIMGPDDVRAARFRETWRGYDEDEVDDFLSRVGHALHVLTTERDEAVARAQQLAHDAQTVLEDDRLLRRTLMTAERTAEETVERAQAEADRIVADAHAESEQLRIEAHERARREVQQAADTADRIRQAVQEFRAFRDDYQSSVRAVMSEHLRALDRVGEVPELPDQVAEFEELHVVRPTAAAAPGRDAGEIDEGIPGDAEEAELSGEHRDTGHSGPSGLAGP